MRFLFTMTLLLSVVAGASVLAQNAGQILMKTPAIEVRFDPPPWATAATVQQTSELSSNEGTGPNGTTYQVLEIIPKGESFDSWSQLYAANVERPLPDDLAAYVASQLTTFSTACAQAGVYHQQDLSETAKVLIIFCAAYKADAARGEVAFFRMEKVGDALAKVYHHVRVPAFDITTSGEQPPLPVEDMRAALTRVGKARVTPVSSQ